VLIDSHAHLGDCSVFDLEITENQLLDTLDRHRVDAAVVQPFPGARSAPEVHDRIAAMAREHPGRIYGLASVNPHWPRAQYRAEIERCVRGLGFVGIKLHTLGHAVGPASRDAQAVYEIAVDLDVPLMVHTGMGVPFALPALFLPVARAHPALRIILAHAGFSIYTAEASAVAQECPNVLLETSWCTPQGIGLLLRTLPPGRVMFGSDLPINLGVELAKVEAIAPDPVRRAAFLATAAADVFRLARVQPTS
jgi:predicted TIM-barrel fold metal-dependent hydrolase